MLQLQDRVTIITGGAQGIGKATANKFADLGAKIAIWDIDRTAGLSLMTALQSAGHEAKFYSVNTVDVNAYAFLASEEASFISGACLSVDGGLVM